MRSMHVRVVQSKFQSSSRIVVGAEGLTGRSADCIKRFTVYGAAAQTD